MKTPFFTASLLLIGGVLSSPLISIVDAEEVISNDLKVVNGNFTDIESYPWAVSFLVMNNIWGAGAILSTKWVLTTAFNCLGMEASFITVRAGSSAWDQDGAVYKVNKCIMHENYTGTYDNNIALLSVSGKMTLASTTAKKILRTAKAKTNGTVLAVSGWGTRSSNHQQETKLQMANQTVMSDKDCMNAYNLTSNTTYFCASNSASGPCVFDYGAPLASVYATKVRLFGLYIGSRNCSDPASWPALYVDVYQFSTWITDTMAAN